MIIYIIVQVIFGWLAVLAGRSLDIVKFCLSELLVVAVKAGYYGFMLYVGIVRYLIEAFTDIYIGPIVQELDAVTRHENTQHQPTWIDEFSVFPFPDSDELETAISETIVKGPISIDSSRLSTSNISPKEAFDHTPPSTVEGSDSDQRQEAKAVRAPNGDDTDPVATSSAQVAAPKSIEVLDLTEDSVEFSNSGSGDGELVSDEEVAPQLVNIIEAVNSQSDTLQYIEDDGFERGTKLGEGGNGAVYKVHHQPTGAIFAVKIQHKSTHSLHEATITAGLRSKRVARVIGMIHDPEYHPMVMEFCDGSLDCAIEKLNGRMRDQFFWRAASHIAEGIAFIHERGIIHGDLKPANVLIKTNPDPRKGMDFMISDFGSAVKDHADPKIPHSHYGTPGYTPPECLERYGYASDLWAYGCILHFMGHKRVPLFYEFDCSKEQFIEQKLQWVIENEPNVTWHEGFCEMWWWQSSTTYNVRPLTSDFYGAMNDNTVPKVLSFIMLTALNHDYKKRPSAKELVGALRVLENLWNSLNSIGYANILEEFNDGTEGGMIEKSIDLSTGMRNLAFTIRLGLANVEDTDPSAFIEPLKAYMTKLHRIFVEKDAMFL